MSKQSKNVTCSCLFGVAVIQGILALLAVSVYGIPSNLIDRIITCSFVLYAVLGIVAKGRPVLAAGIGSFLYALFLLLQLVTGGTEALRVGLIFKIPIVLLLVVAVLGACKVIGEKPVETKRASEAAGSDC